MNAVPEMVSGILTDSCFAFSCCALTAFSVGALAEGSALVATGGGGATGIAGGSAFTTGGAGAAGASAFTAGFSAGVGFTSRRSEEHTSALQSLMRISYAVFCLKKKTNNTKHTTARLQ